MSSENIKKVYVVNLNNGRVIILSGVIILLMGLTFLAGTKWVKQDITEAANVMQFSQNIKSESPVEINPAPGLDKQKNIAELPDEDNKIFEQNTRDKEDPFLSAPHEKSVAAKKDSIKTALPKTEKKITRHKEKTVTSEIPVKSNDKSYSAQAGAFVHEKDANALKAKLIEKKLDARVDKGAVYYFVRSGKSRNKESLDPIIEKIHDRLNIQAIVVQNKVP